MANNIECWQDRISIVHCSCGDYETAHDSAHATMSTAYCPSCEREVPIEDIEDTNRRGWFYWYCFPGCLPDSSLFGPFATRTDALAEANDGDDDEGDDDESEDQ